MMFAGVSDAFDGGLARWLHQQTTLGLYLDPIADKLLLSTLFITLTLVHDIPRYVTILVFARDLGILLIAILLFATNTLRDFRPSILGKVNTFLQIVLRRMPDGLSRLRDPAPRVPGRHHAARHCDPGPDLRRAVRPGSSSAACPIQRQSRLNEPLRLPSRSLR